MMHAQNVSIVIPTMNRPCFVEAMARLLVETGFGGQLVLCDSSSSEVYAATRRTLCSMEPGYQVAHLHFPGKSAGNAAAAAAAEICMPYSVYLPDDDMPVPRTLEACAAFLDCSPDYVAATGHAVMAHLEHGRVLSVAPYHLRSFEDDDPRDRLADLLSKYCVVHFSLLRTACMNAFFAAALPVKDIYLGNELMINCLAVVAGKVKRLDRLFVVRQNHSDRDVTMDFFDWITNDAWSGSMRTVQATVAEAMAASCELSVAQVNLWVKKSLWTYVSSQAKKHYDGKYSDPTRPDRIRDWIKHSDTLVRHMKYVRSWLPIQDGAFSLEALSRPSSALHLDFMPIYRTLTGEAPAEHAKPRNQIIFIKGQ